MRLGVFAKLCAVVKSRQGLWLHVFVEPIEYLSHSEFQKHVARHRDDQQSLESSCTE